MDPHIPSCSLLALDSSAHIIMILHIWCLPTNTHIVHTYSNIKTNTTHFPQTIPDGSQSFIALKMENKLQTNMGSVKQRMVFCRSNTIDKGNIGGIMSD